ncbi:MAG: hypothetical protein FJZ09_01345 [Candidatus Omnitrophica bacterium]|nr:hypothetical protein [Candidatus Omnitrophota bacterium]
MKAVLTLVFSLIWAVPGFCWRDSLEYDRSVGQWTYQGGALTPLEEVKSGVPRVSPESSAARVVLAPKTRNEAMKPVQPKPKQTVSNRPVALPFQNAPAGNASVKASPAAKAAPFDFKGDFSDTGAGFDEPTATFSSPTGIFDESSGDFKSSDGIFDEPADAFDEPSADFSARD